VRAARLAGLTLIPDPIPEENLFVRSDQYSFVRKGVPSVFLVPGFTSSDKAIDGPKLFGEFLATHYHQPSDDLTLPVDAGSVERFTRANVALGYLIASEPSAPRWKPGNFFGTTFGPR
jgi:Zn-dependent M28 family amino/carboxypeptidase